MAVDEAGECVRKYCDIAGNEAAGCVRKRCDMAVDETNNPV